MFFLNILGILRKNWFVQRILRVKAALLNPAGVVRGRNNKITNLGNTIQLKYDIVGNNNSIIIEQTAQISNVTIYMRGDNHRLHIKEKCSIKGGNIWFEDSNCEISIGSNTTIESAHLAVTEPNRRITIGEDCMFSYQIELRTGDSHSIIDTVTNERVNFAKDIVIDNHVWVGAHSIILKGVDIGNDPIIGINSIVTQSIPSNSIAAGIPAKVIKNNVTWNRKRMYTENSNLKPV